VKGYTGDHIDESNFQRHFAKLYSRMYSLEKTKYLPPKYSYGLKELCQYLGIFEKEGTGASDTLSTASSRFSVGFGPRSHNGSRYNLSVRSREASIKDSIIEEEENEYLYVNSRNSPRSEINYPKSRSPIKKESANSLSPTKIRLRTGNSDISGSHPSNFRLNLTDPNQSRDYNTSHVPLIKGRKAMPKSMLNQTYDQQSHMTISSHNRTTISSNSTYQRRPMPTIPIMRRKDSRQQPTKYTVNRSLAPLKRGSTSIETEHARP